MLAYDRAAMFPHRCRLLSPLFAMTTFVSGAEFPGPSELSPQPHFPDPLTSFTGEEIKTREEWLNARRPELRRLFEFYQYGALPPEPAGIETRVLHTDPKAFGGKATLREIAITPQGVRVWPMHLLLVVPNQRQAPVPVFVGLNFCGNHTLVADPKVRIPRGWMEENCPGVADHLATEAGRGSQAEVWAIEQTISRGYATATMWYGDADSDRHVPGDLGLPANRGSLARWAWALMRCVDYLATDKDLDPSRIAVVGHSRNGKAALLAGAFDQRIALIIPHQAGCGGTAPSRVAPELAKLQANGRPTAETLAMINRNFPHWFCERFKHFNDAPEKLPFDQHCLIAMCAPRPVLLSNATEDRWANPDGQFEMLRAADPVYKLVAGEGLGAPSPLPAGMLLRSRLGYFIREGKHSMTPADWKVWLDYAGEWMK